MMPVFYYLKCRIYLADTNTYKNKNSTNNNNELYLNSMVAYFCHEIAR